MALVHSRVRRVIFKMAQPGGLGALQGRWHLHGVRGLNHRYSVYALDGGDAPERG
jgi:hypothetical protein